MPSNRELLDSMPDGRCTPETLWSWYWDNRAAIRLALERAEKAEALLRELRDCPINQCTGCPAKIDAHFAEGEKPDNYPHEHECGSCGVHWECRSMGCAFNYLANCDPGTGCNQLRTNH